MRFLQQAAFAALATWIGGAVAHNIQLKAHSRECFHEELHRDDKMTVTFQVGDREFGGSGNLDIDFWVTRTPNASLRSLCSHTFALHTIADATCLSYFRTTARQMLTVDYFCRSKIPPAPNSITSNPSALATTPSPRIWTGNTSTASRTSIGQPTARKCHSTFTASFMCRSQKRRAIRWSWKVGYYNIS